MAQITEQTNTVDASDPFAPEPYDSSLTGDALKKHQLEYQGLYMSNELEAYTMKLDMINAEPNSTLKRNYVGKNMTGGKSTDVQIDSYAYDTTQFSPRVAAWLKVKGPRINALNKAIAKNKRDLKALEKTMTAAAMTANANAAAASGKAGALSAAQIPQNIQTNPGNTRGQLQNPYLRNTVPGGEYAGHPSGYKFSTPMRTMYTDIEATLKQVGLTMDKLYVGRIVGPINFIGVSNNDKFVWYKYDMGGASGQNSMYFNGYKIKSSSFIAMTMPARIAFLKTHGVI